MITARTERRGGKVNIRDKTQDFRKANSIFCKKLLGRISWKTTITGKVSRTAIDFYRKFIDSWGIKHLTVQKTKIFFIGSGWLNREFPNEQKCKTGVCENQSEGQDKGGLWKQCISTKVRPLQKAKVQLREVKKTKGKMKGLYKHSL